MSLRESAFRVVKQTLLGLITSKETLTSIYQHFTEILPPLPLLGIHNERDG